jgi:hypothetical protein
MGVWSRIQGLRSVLVDSRRRFFGDSTISLGIWRIVDATASCYADESENAFGVEREKRRALRRVTTAERRIKLRFQEALRVRSEMLSTIGHGYPLWNRLKKFKK